MIDWNLAGFFIGYTSISAFALFLLDRSHRSAIAKLAELYDQQAAVQMVLLKTLDLALDALSKENTP